MEERRNAQRASVVNLDLYYQETQEKMGKVINLSEGGLMVITDKQFDENTFLNVRFLFNKRINFDLSVRVVWSDISTRNKSKFNTGMEIIENPELQIRFIQQMIKVYGQD